MLYSSSATWPWLSPKGPSGFDLGDVDIALDHHLGLGRHHQRHGAGPDHVDRCAGKTARDGELVHPDRQLLRTHEGHVGRAAEHDGHRHLGVAARLVLEVVLVAARAAHARRHAHHQPVGRLPGPQAIGAHVLHAVLGVGGYDVGRAQGGRAVETGGSRLGSAKGRARGPPCFRISPSLDDLVAGRVRHVAGRHRVRDGVRPLVADAVHVAAHAGGIDRTVRGQPADDDGDLVSSPGLVADVGEEECLAVLFLEASGELPAHEGVQFAVLVDLAVDANQQSLFPRDARYGRAGSR